MPASLPSVDGAARFRAAVQLSLRRSASGALAGVALAVLALQGVGAAALAFVPSVRAVALPDLLSVATSVFAWGGALFLAIFAGRAAFLRDREDGVFHVFRLRGVRPGALVLARTMGLALLLALVLFALVATTTLAALGANALEGSTIGTAPGAEVSLLRMALACFVYAAAFAGVVAPVVVATLGLRARSSDPLGLIVLFFLPEVLAFFVPASTSARAVWGDVLSLPGALAAVRHGIAGGGAAGGLLRGLVGLALFAFASLLALRAQAALAKEFRL